MLLTNLTNGDQKMEIKESLKIVDAHIKNLRKGFAKRKVWRQESNAEEILERFNATKRQIKSLENDLAKLKKSEEKKKEIEKQNKEKLKALKGKK